MIAIKKNCLTFYQFKRFNDYGIKHGFFTRLGGVSPEPFGSLNMATTVGDTNENVLENLRRMFDVFGLDLATRYDGWQVHSATTICTDVPRNIRTRTIRTDGLITDKPEVTLVMRFGDCVPVIVYDPVQEVSAIYHAGWQGTVAQIGRNVIRNMTEIYGCDPKNIIAGIGPSIGPDHFVVKQDVQEKFVKTFPEEADRIISVENGLIHIDLWRANQITLEKAGVNQIEVGEICTVCNKHEWFSHRGDHGRTGRFGVLITLG